MHDPRPRIRARIPHSLWVRLKAATMGDVTQSDILTKALSAHFSYEIDDQRDAKIIERLELMTRHNHRLSQDFNLLTETFAQYLQYFFTLAPRVPESEKDVRGAQGLVDFNQFIDRLGGTVKPSKNTLKHALKDVLIAEEDFYTLDELELVRALSAKRVGSNA